jgi:hypothetical protein
VTSTGEGDAKSGMNAAVSRGIRGFRIARSSAAEALVVVGAFALGIGLLTSQIPRDIPGWVPLASGALLVVGTLLYIWNTRFGSLTESTDTEAFFVWNASDNRLIEVLGYEFSEELAQYASRAMSEHTPLQIQWRDDPLWDDNVASREVISMPGRRRSGRIIAECVEYMLLNRLSLHLSAFFSKPGFSPDRLVVYGREDVADVIQGNRILELFSRPLEDRMTASSPLEYDLSFGDTPAIIESDGTYYSRFEMRLPSGCRLHRSEGAIVIDSPVFDLRLSVQFDGFHTVLPGDFERLYLGGSLIELQAFAVVVRVSTTIKRRAILRRQDWAYFTWHDSFSDYLRRHWAHEAFFADIGWPSLRALFHVSSSKADQMESPGRAKRAPGRLSKRPDRYRPEPDGGAVSEDRS